MATPNTEVIERAIQVIMRLQDASSKILRDTLCIDQATAEAVLDGLEDSGIVTARDVDGARDISGIWKASPVPAQSRRRTT